MSVRDVYGIKDALEPAIQKVLEDQALAVLTTQDPQSFQKDRERVEVMFVLGAGKGAHLAISETTGLECEVEDAWGGTVYLALITAADARIHGECEAMVRYVMARLPNLVNDALENHAVYGPVLTQGTSPVLVTQEGRYQTEMQFGISVAILRDAWAKLNQ